MLRTPRSIAIADTLSILDDRVLLTLGGTGKENEDRHPKIRRGVLIGAGAKVLGNIEVGQCARVAAGSVKPNQTVKVLSRDGSVVEQGRVSKILAFRGLTRAELARVTPEQALSHPTWDMGPVVTINSATLMNKGLELIEAHHLFAIEPDRLDVIVHPQSIVHGLVYWRDGAVTAGLAMPDMRVPIAHCLGLGERRAH